MSDIGIFSNPWDLAAVFLIIGSPGLALGALAGALLWRRRRIAGAALGALAGFAAWFGGWALWKMVL